MEKRKEEIAFHWADNILWLAYRYSGGGKEEVAYTEGWKFDVVGAERLSQLRKVLSNYFEPAGSDSLGSLFPPFLGCETAYLDQQLPLDIKAVLQEFLTSTGVNHTEIKGPRITLDAINSRWSGPLGETTPANEVGSARALAIMQAGINV